MQSCRRALIVVTWNTGNYDAGGHFSAKNCLWHPHKETFGWSWLVAQLFLQYPRKREGYILNWHKTGIKTTTSGPHQFYLHFRIWDRSLSTPIYLNARKSRRVPIVPRRRPLSFRFPKKPVAFWILLFLVELHFPFNLKVVYCALMLF